MGLVVEGDILWICCWGINWGRLEILFVEV